MNDAGIVDRAAVAVDDHRGVRPGNIADIRILADDEILVAGSDAAEGDGAVLSDDGALDVNVVLVAEANDGNSGL